MACARDMYIGERRTAATVQVASAPKSTNYRRNDMAEKSSQMKKREFPETQQTKKQTKSQMRRATIGQMRPPPPPIEGRRQKSRENETKTKEFSKSEIDKNFVKQF